MCGESRDPAARLARLVRSHSRRRFPMSAGWARGTGGAGRVNCPNGDIVRGQALSRRRPFFIPVTLGGGVETRKHAVPKTRTTTYGNGPLRRGKTLSGSVYDG